jgi:hypothetical protein
MRTTHRFDTFKEALLSDGNLKCIIMDRKHIDLGLSFVSILQRNVGKLGLIRILPEL